MLHAFGLGNIEETGWLGQDQQVYDLIRIKFCNIVWTIYPGRTIKLNGSYAPPPPGLSMPGLHSDPFSQSFHYTKADLGSEGKMVQYLNLWM